MQMTDRDDAMLAWLSVVRLADVDAVRWALAGLAGNDSPVTTRRANVWISRMVDVGLLGRGRPNFRDGSIVWATHQAIGKSAPNLYRQTTRHEVAVAAVSARYLAHGYTWSRDRKPRQPGDHQTDGVATKDGISELVEVELTAKTLERYPGIFRNHEYRMTHDAVSRVVYFGTQAAVSPLSKWMENGVAFEWYPRIPLMPVFDVRGNWVTSDFGLWGDSNEEGTADFADANPSARDSVTEEGNQL